MTELQGHEDRLEISANSGVFVRSREKGSHGRSRVGGSAPALCQRAGCYQSHPWDLHPAPGIRHRGRDLGEVVSFGQKPDRLKVPCRGHIRARPVLLLQSRNAQMIRHMRHGSSPRLMALQPIRVTDPGESPADSISRSPYNKEPYLIPPLPLVPASVRSGLLAGAEAGTLPVRLQASAASSVTSLETGSQNLAGFGLPGCP